MSGLRRLWWLVLAAVLAAASSSIELLVMRETGLSSLLRPAPALFFIIVLCLGNGGLIASLLGISVGYSLAVLTTFPLTIAKPVTLGSITLIFAGMSIQAWFQTRLYRGFDQFAPARLHRCWAVLIVAPIGSVISPTVSTLVLVSESAILHLPPSRFWIVAYAGTVLGLVMAFPLAWMLDRQVRLLTSWRDQAPLTAALGMILIGGWFATWVVQEASIGVEQRHFQDRVSLLASELQDQAEDVGMVAAGLQAGLSTSGLAPKTLERLAQNLMGRISTIEAVLLLRAVQPAQQADFEARLSLGGAPRRIRWQSDSQRVQALALKRAEMVVEHAAPATFAALWEGLALSVEPEAAELFARSEPLGGEGGGSGPLVLPRHGNRLAWVVPIYLAQERVPGLIVLVQRPERIVQAAVENIGGLPEGGGMILSDVSVEPRQPIYYGDSGGRLLSAEQVYREAPNGTLHRDFMMKIVDRDWRLEILQPTNSAFAFSSSWWLNQTLVQLLALGLALTLMIAFERRMAMREMEAQVSVLSRRFQEFDREFDRDAEDDAANLLPARPTLSAITLDIELTRRDGLLARAFRGGAFKQHYEPVVHLATGHIIGFESLLRWPDAPEAFTAPQIIDWAERAELVHVLTLDALREAIELVELWRASASASGQPVPWVSINVSPDDVGKPAFIEQMLDLFRRHPMARNQIKLEITEGVLVRDFKGVAQRLRSMRAEGIGIALDDFGTGYSSLSYLHQLPVDSIKIDRSFISSLTSERRGRDIVQATVELGRRLHIEVVAEGVEDLHTIGLLRRYGCHAAQGYLFSRARPAVVIDEWVRTHKRFDIA
ncbi:EAL domain-containing protein [Hydrocarboniphaga effusa]|jgi:EAL domain-containing protein (putative c-di-GMP-specific phosphodiesterase class I)